MSDPESSETHDGFTTVDKYGTGVTTRTHVTMGAVASLTLPEACLDCTRIDWQFLGDILRARLSNHGQFKLTQNGPRARTVSVRSLRRALGRDIRGRYPVTRIDGCDLYIDISEPAS